MNTYREAGPDRAVRLLRLPQVKDITGLGRSTIYSSIAKGEFPSPVRIGSRAVAWRESDVAAWVADRPATGPCAEEAGR